MKIRRYIAKDNHEAILKVKVNLGNDAIILSTRKIRQKGLLKFFTKPMVEVLAAVDDDNAEKNIPSNQDKETEIEKKVKSLENKMMEISNRLDGGRPNGADSDDTAGRAQFPKYAQIFYENLLKKDVDSEIAKKLIETTVAKTSHNPGINETASVLYNIVSGIIGKQESIRLKNGEPTIVMFVGPTGVGKTTTLAKIAAKYLINHKKNIGLITADTYRIAAVEQLKTYAEILGVPLYVSYTPEDMSDAIMKYSDKDLILIDTAGRSHKNKSQFEELKEFVEASKADEIFLVMSASTSLRNCREILQAYSFIKDYKIILTKADEVPELGIVLNIKYLSDKKLSYITNGQNVPDDIEEVNTEKITKSLIGSIC